MKRWMKRVCLVLVALISLCGESGLAGAGEFEQLPAVVNEAILTPMKQAFEAVKKSEAPLPFDPAEYERLRDERVELTGQAGGTFPLRQDLDELLNRLLALQTSHPDIWFPTDSPEVANWLSKCALAANDDAKRIPTSCLEEMHDVLVRVRKAVSVRLLAEFRKPEAHPVLLEWGRLRAKVVAWRNKYRLEPGQDTDVFFSQLGAAQKRWNEIAKLAGSEDEAEKLFAAWKKREALKEDLEIYMNDYGSRLLKRLNTAVPWRSWRQEKAYLATLVERLSNILALTSQKNDFVKESTLGEIAKVHEEAILSLAKTYGVVESLTMSVATRVRRILWVAFLGGAWWCYRTPWEDLSDGPSATTIGVVGAIAAFWGIFRGTTEEVWEKLVSRREGTIPRILRKGSARWNRLLASELKTESRRTIQKLVDLDPTPVGEGPALVAIAYQRHCAKQVAQMASGELAIPEEDE